MGSECIAGQFEETEGELTRYKLSKSKEVDLPTCQNIPTELWLKA